MRMQYRVCPYCDSNLDPEERCDCQDEQEGRFVEKVDQSGGLPATVDWYKSILMPGA